MRTWLERVPADSKTGKHLERWRALREEGWELTVLHHGPSSSLVALGFLPEADRKRTLRAATEFRPGLETRRGRQ
jgi:hypothetical protein